MFEFLLYVFLLIMTIVFPLSALVTIRLFSCDFFLCCCIKYDCLLFVFKFESIISIHRLQNLFH